MIRVFGDWLDQAQPILSMIEEGGFAAYVVGGCVRNALLDLPVADVDIATDARPQQVMKLARAAGHKALPTGIDHGTVTLINDGIPYEVTSFRADIATDGRRAVISFAKDLPSDARRRDFTMNALYVDRHGVVSDPLGGLKDLRARRFRFIEEAERRIREDYLRILRFFRLTAWYGDPAAGMDPEALAAIAENLDGIDKLSAERITSELLKLLSAPDPVFATCVMEQTGVLHRILPGAQSAALGPLVQHEQSLDLTVAPLRRLAVLGGHEGAPLRLSRNEKRQISLYQSLIGGPEGLPEISWRHGADIARDILALRAALLGGPVQRAMLKEIDAAAAARFPLSAGDLMPKLSGPALGVALRRLERHWIDSGFSLDREALLALADEVR